MSSAAGADGAGASFTPSLFHSEQGVGSTACPAEDQCRARVSYSAVVWATSRWQAKATMAAGGGGGNAGPNEPLSPAARRVQLSLARTLLERPSIGSFNISHRGTSMFKATSVQQLRTKLSVSKRPQPQQTKIVVSGSIGHRVWCLNSIYMRAVYKISGPFLSRLCLLDPSGNSFQYPLSA